MIDTGNEFAMKASKSHKFVGYVKAFCNNEVPSYQWSFEGLQAGSIPDSFDPSSFIQDNQHVLSVPGNFLLSGATYIYKFSANQGTITGEAFLYLSVEDSDIVAKINKSDGQISSVVDLVLDGSGSFDPDGSSNGLLYEWSCDCGTALFTDERSNTLIIPQNLLNVGSVYTITLEVWAGTRHATDQVTLEVCLLYTSDAADE